MRQADLSLLHERISNVVRTSPVGKRAGRVSLEPDQDGDGDHFLRVMIELKAAGKVRHSELVTLVRAIEDTVQDLDDRFTSVRFPDAA